jgi:hypothetical protein
MAKVAPTAIHGGSASWRYSTGMCTCATRGDAGVKPVRSRTHQRPGLRLAAQQPHHQPDEARKHDEARRRADGDKHDLKGAEAAAAAAAGCADGYEGPYGQAVNVLGSHAGEEQGLQQRTGCAAVTPDWGLVWRTGFGVAGQRALGAESGARRIEGSSFQPQSHPWSHPWPHLSRAGSGPGRRRCSYWTPAGRAVLRRADWSPQSKTAGRRRRVP